MTFPIPNGRRPPPTPSPQSDHNPSASIGVQGAMLHLLLGEVRIQESRGRNRVDPLKPSGLTKIFDGVIDDALALSQPTSHITQSFEPSRRPPIHFTYPLISKLPASWLMLKEKRYIALLPKFDDSLQGRYARRQEALGANQRVRACSVWVTKY